MIAKRKGKQKYTLFFDEGGMIQSRPTDPPKSGYSAMMKHLVDVKGGVAGDYEDLMNRIAYHETGAQQRMRPDAIQIVDGKKAGVGRGLFQFEVGDGAGGITAVNRTYQEFKNSGMEVPDWLEKAYTQKSLDASKLTGEQQKVLFIGNYLRHPKANLGAWREGKVSTEQFWGNFHHAGGATTNYDSFRESMTDYDKTYSK